MFSLGKKLNRAYQVSRFHLTIAKTDKFNILRKKIRLRYIPPTKFRIWDGENVIQS